MRKNLQSLRCSQVASHGLRCGVIVIVLFCLAIRPGLAQTRLVETPHAPENVWVSPGISDVEEVVLGEDALMVNVPNPGVYLLMYSTDTGDPLYVVFQVRKNVLVTLGVPHGVTVRDVTLVQGTAVEEVMSSSDGQDFGLMTLLYTPDSPGSWYQYMAITPSITVVVLIQDGVIVVHDPTATKKTCKTKKTKKTKK